MWLPHRRKVTDTDGDHFVIAPESTAILRTLELDIDCCFFVAIIVFAPFAPDPFDLHSNKPLPEFIYFLFRPYQFEYMFLGQACHQKRPGWQAKKKKKHLNLIIISAKFKQNHNSYSDIKSHMSVNKAPKLINFRRLRRTVYLCACAMSIYSVYYCQHLTTPFFFFFGIQQNVTRPDPRNIYSNWYGLNTE